MDHDILAHLHRLSCLELEAVAEVERRPLDIIEELESVRSMLIERSLDNQASIVNMAIGEIQRLRNRVDELSASVYTMRSI